MLMHITELRKIIQREFYALSRVIELSRNPFNTFSFSKIFQTPCNSSSPRRGERFTTTQQQQPHPKTFKILLFVVSLRNNYSATRPAKKKKISCTFKKKKKRRVIFSKKTDPRSFPRRTCFMEIKDSFHETRKRLPVIDPNLCVVISATLRRRCVGYHVLTVRAGKDVVVGL